MTGPSENFQKEKKCLKNASSVIQHVLVRHSSSLFPLEYTCRNMSYFQNSGGEGAICNPDEFSGMSTIYIAFWGGVAPQHRCWVKESLFLDGGKPSHLLFFKRLEAVEAGL